MPTPANLPPRPADTPLLGPTWAVYDAIVAGRPLSTLGQSDANLLYALGDLLEKGFITSATEIRR